MDMLPSIPRAAKSLDQVSNCSAFIGWIFTEPERNYGGLQPKKPMTTANFKFGTGFFCFFFGFFFGFSIFADFDWFNGFWLSGYNSFYMTFAGLNRR